MATNKIIIASAALMAGFASAASAAEGMKVTLGGDLNTQLGYRDQDSKFKNQFPDTATSNALHKFSVVNDTKLHVKADGSARGMKYGAMVELNADTSASKTANSSIARQTKMYVDTMFGKLEAGSTFGAYDALRVSMVNSSKATGGINGDAKYWWNPMITGTDAFHAKDLVVNNFITNPSLPTSVDADTKATANKISYFTPQYMGIKAGVSYIPDVDMFGTVAGINSVFKNKSNQLGDATNNPVAADKYGQVSGFKNVFSGGFHFGHKFDKVTVKASLVGEAGTAKNTNTPNLSASNNIKRQDLRAWEVGGSVNFMGFTAAGSYGDWGKSGTPKLDTTAGAAVTGKKKSHFWNAGLAYEHNTLGASVGYFESKRGGLNKAAHKEARIISFGVDYKAAPGFMPYVEANWFRLKDKNTSGNKNDGTILLAGTKLMF
jgi:hypothetical protein